MGEESKTEDFSGQNAGCLSRLRRGSASLVPSQATLQNNDFSSGFWPLLFRFLSDYLGLYRLKLSISLLPRGSLKASTVVLRVVV